ncbi:MAG TPA: ABC transporter permease [Anaerolineae bacterium]|nr:ABC transporter permease [Anaerolineae bacterium]HMR65035.1 ABC transporter permease [Anaerolineae bacterium]
MSTTSATLPARSRTPLPSILMALVAGLLVLAGLALVLVGVLNLDRPSSYLFIPAGLLMTGVGTVWGARSVRATTGASIGQQFLVANAVLVFLFFYLPILALVIFSFNAGEIPTVWEGFSLRWYASLLESEATVNAFRNTMIVTFISTIISTIIGTMVSLVMERYNFPLKLPFDAVLYMPIIVPDIVIALATLLFFNLIAFNIVQNLLGLQWGLGLTTIIIAHVAFNISFVATIVRARLVDMDPNLEQAARDLGANEWQVFRRVTMPILMPGIVSGALLAFTLSLDDFVITFFVSGPGSTTLPLLVYSQLKFGVEPDINALTSVMLLFSIGLVLLSQFLQRRA